MSGSENCTKRLLKQKISSCLRTAMASLLDSHSFSDVILKTSDGSELQAHLCVLKARAPSFFQKYISPVLSSEPNGKLQVSIDDVDMPSLRFFLKCVYTDDEITSYPTGEVVKKSNDDSIGSDKLQGESEGNWKNRQTSTETRTLSSPEEIDRSSTSQTSAATHNIPDYMPGESENEQTGDEYLRRVMQQVETAILLQPKSAISASRHRLLAQEYSSASSLAGHVEMLPSVPENHRVMSRSYDDNVVMTSFAKLQSSIEGSSIVTTPEREHGGIDPQQFVVAELKNDIVETPVRRDRSTSESTRRSGSLTFRRTMGHPDTDGMEVVSARVDNRPSSLYFATGRDDEESYVSEAESSIRNGIMRCERFAAEPKHWRSSNSLRSEGIGKFISGAPVLASPAEEVGHGDMDLGNPTEAKGQMFSMFIDLGQAGVPILPIVPSLDENRGGYSSYTNSLSRKSSGKRKRWSIVSDQISIGSADNVSLLDDHNAIVTSQLSLNVAPIPRQMTASENTIVGEGGVEVCSRLGQDLLQMFADEIHADVDILVDGQMIKAHKSILSTVCPYFASLFSGDWKEGGQKSVELKGYSTASVKYTLGFIYGGSLSVPDDVDIFEVLGLADMLQLDNLKSVIEFHIHINLCHGFHKPCASCLANTFKHLATIKQFGLTRLYEAALNWISRHFASTWTRKGFHCLPDHLHTDCYEALVKSLTPSTVLDVIFGCERIQTQLSKAKGSSPVAGLVACVDDVALEYVAAHFDSVLSSERFLSLGKGGLHFNLGLIDDVLSAAVHALSPDMACKGFIRVEALLFVLNTTAEDNLFAQRFVQLIRRLHELLTTHILHFASQVVKCDMWNSLPMSMQERIRQYGIFIDFTNPVAAPPKFSSLHRKFNKRSTSTGPPATATRLERKPSGPGSSSQSPTAKRSSSLQRKSTFTPSPPSQQPTKLAGTPPLSGTSGTEPIDVAQKRPTGTLGAAKRSLIPAPTKQPSVPKLDTSDINIQPEMMETDCDTARTVAAAEPTSSGLSEPIKSPDIPSEDIPEAEPIAVVPVESSEDSVTPSDEPKSDSTVVHKSPTKESVKLSSADFPVPAAVEKPSNSATRPSVTRSSRSLKPTAEVKPLGSKTSGISGRLAVSSRSSGATTNGVKSASTSAAKPSRPAALEPHSPPARKKIVRSQTTTKAPKEQPKGVEHADSKTTSLHRSPEIKNFATVDSSPADSKNPRN